MPFPEFFNYVAPLALHDPLAQALGAAEDGVIVYRYTDAVRLAGHSCPTVAGAWLMARHALAHLYPDSLPLRGGLMIELRDAQEMGTTGVVGNILGFVTGAAGKGGFKGLNGRYARCNLLSHGVPMGGDVRFTRLDTGAAVEASYHPGVVPPAPPMQSLMPLVMTGNATAEAIAEFGRLWQDRVRRILVEHGDDPALVTLRSL